MEVKISKKIISKIFKKKWRKNNRKKEKKFLAGPWWGLRFGLILCSRNKNDRKREEELALTNPTTHTEKKTRPYQTQT